MTRDRETSTPRSGARAIDKGFNALYDTLLDVAKVNVEYGDDGEAIENAEKVLRDWACMRYRNVSDADLLALAYISKAAENPYVVHVLKERGVLPSSNEPR